jgi:hypothetical protein
MEVSDIRRVIRALRKYPGQELRCLVATCAMGCLSIFPVGTCYFCQWFTFPQVLRWFSNSGRDRADRSRRPPRRQRWGRMCLDMVAPKRNPRVALLHFSAVFAVLGVSIVFAHSVRNRRVRPVGQLAAYPRLASGRSGAHVWFPKQAAATTLEWLSKRFCFIGTETCREFEKQRGDRVEVSWS